MKQLVGMGIHAEAKYFGVILYHEIIGSNGNPVESSCRCN
jgi:hypothetical protein